MMGPLDLEECSSLSDESRSITNCYPAARPAADRADLVWMGCSFHLVHSGRITSDGKSGYCPPPNRALQRPQES
eukprot:SAG31_NODE_1282_length_9017_cov_10.333146_6_plen_74_part_00